MRSRDGPIRFLALAWIATSCGYAASGTWEDDPGDWERAFGMDPPDGVEIVRSRHWRSPHFTYECAYFFEIAANEELELEIFDENEMSRLEGDAARDAMHDTVGRRPEWFTPLRSADAYEVWTYADDPTGNFRLYIDRETRTLFLADGQL
jgi:hypothetical protein